MPEMVACHGEPPLVRCYCIGRAAADEADGGARSPGQRCGRQRTSAKKKGTEEQRNGIATNSASVTIPNQDLDGRLVVFRRQCQVFFLFLSSLTQFCRALWLLLVCQIIAQSLLLQCTFGTAFKALARCMFCLLTAF